MKKILKGAVPKNKGVKMPEYVLPPGLFDAVVKIQRHCENQNNCKDCCFFAKGEYSSIFPIKCLLTRWQLPEDWADNTLIREIIKP